MQRNLLETVDKIKPLTEYLVLLIRFSLIVGDERVNCISNNKEVVDSVMCLVDGKNSVDLFGYYNSRNKLMVHKLIIKNYYSSCLMEYRA